MKLSDTPKLMSEDYKANKTYEKDTEIYYPTGLPTESEAQVVVECQLTKGKNNIIAYKDACCLPKSMWLKIIIPSL